MKKCSTRLVSGTVKFITDPDDLGVSVSRGRDTYATSIAVPAVAGGWRLVLTHHMR